MEEDRVSDEETLLLHFKRNKFIKLSPLTTNRDNPKKTRRRRIGVNSIHTQSSKITTLIPNRKKRSERNNKNRWYGSDIIHDQQHLEEQEVAMCLIMLSTHNNILHSDLSNHNNSQNPDRNTTKVAILKDKNTQFECTTCNQMFHSYQALGGHRASHNKNNNLLLASPQPKTRNKKMRVHNNHHQCPICFKLFQSGQALGGHKRSHLLASQTNNNPSQPSLVINPVPEVTRSFLDLNLPAPTDDEEDEREESCSTTVGWTQP